MSFLKSTLGGDLASRIKDAKILVVGAGGIGCELLKNLVLSGFENITIVDLDTIDVSNLNRQFLFRSHHVGQSKAVVAREVALQFNPNAKITAYHENIKTGRYSIDYFESFTIVMNALDNVDARKHVNRLCLAVQVPLIESGTTGYLGQVSVIKKGDTECYECTEKATAKVYPICTIRSTPDKMVHCIVWAKECFKLLFGKMQESMLWEDPSNEDKSAFMDQVLATGLNGEDYAKDVFRGLFEHEIQKKLDIKVYKTAIRQPSPIYYDKLDIPAVNSGPSDTWNDRALWSVEECIGHFIHCVAQLKSSPEIGLLEFDKDDALAMQFVTAAANLRAHVFGIGMESMYSCKGIAGNIIPAIATTNAIVAGLQVLEAFKILRNNNATPINKACHYTYCNRSWDSRGVLLTPVALSSPNPKCFVCSRQVLDLGLHVQSTTLQQLVDQFFKKRLGMNEPTISIGANTIYEEGDDAEEALRANLSKKLTELPGGGVHHDSIISAEDFSQDFNCSIRIKHLDDLSETEDFSFVFGSDWVQRKKGETHDDQEVVIDHHEKRKVEEENHSSKRLKNVSD
ncbi:hypothetical protein LEN26_002359 [Aphanomyces euteiches]|nr:hypothetical protein LEN26_002359 [Aphanomyces euteiches]